MTATLARVCRVVTHAPRRQCIKRCPARPFSCSRVLYKASSATGSKDAHSLQEPRARNERNRPDALERVAAHKRIEKQIKVGVKGEEVEWTQRLGLFYGNEFYPSQGGLRSSVLDPTNTTRERPRIIAEVSYPSAEDIDRIVTGAQAALKGPWKDYTGEQRAHLLNHLADLIEKHTHTIATIETLNSGKAFTVSSGWDVPHTVDVLRYYASLAPTIKNERIDRQGGQWVEIVKSPVGVVGALVPWNYPLAMAAWKLAPALAAGCTIVLKTSEFTPLSMLYVAELVREAGFPPGVVNIITGDKTTGAALVRHPGLSKIAFTGSTQAGKSIMKQAADSLKPVTLETGGKSPLIVFEDADLDEAVKHAHEGVFQNQGQVCTATSRILVHNSVLGEFLEKFKDITERLSVVGDPFEERTFQGPQISASHQEKITTMIDSTRREAEERKAGEVIWQSPNIKIPSKGFFVPPTIISPIHPESPAWKEEIFGPVACVMGFEKESEALELANDTAYGLAGAVFTEDTARKRRVALGLQAGTVWVGSNQDCDVRVPFGGWGESGLGRELGRDGLESYLAKKAVYWCDG